MAEPLRDFYSALSQVSFTILGLWLVVVQLRRKEWAAEPRRRLGARAVTLHFALPGVMSLLSLASVSSTVVWRVAFAAMGLLGGVGVWFTTLAAERDAAARSSVVEGWVGVVVYGMVATVAVAAPLAARLFDASALQVEAVLASVLVFLGLNVAFRLLFAQPRPQ